MVNIICKIHIIIMMMMMMMMISSGFLNNNNNNNKQSFERKAPVTTSGFQGGSLRSKKCITYGTCQLRWLPRVSTKVTLQTGKTCKRSPSSIVLQSLLMNFTSKVTNIITLIFQFLFLRHRPLSWQQSI